MYFPRPNPDTGIGVHHDANTYWQPHGDLNGYAQMLRDNGVSWYLEWLWDRNKFPWVAALVRAGIMPIVRIGPAYMPRPAIDPALIDGCLDAGAKWFMLGNEYNLHTEWTEWWPNSRRPVEHVARWYVRLADEIRGKGGWPLTPPPSLGGHILHREWFIRFMDRLSEIAQEQGRPMKELLYPGGIGLHCRSCGNPLHHGPEDYDCSAREWEWFDDRVKEYVGESLPMANGEWGDEPAWYRRLNPELGIPEKWEWWRSRNIQQMCWSNPGNDGYRYPDHVFANCFWLLQDGGVWDDCGLRGNQTYRREMGISDTTVLFDQMPTFITWDRTDGEEPPPPPPPPTPPDPEDPSGEIEFVGLSEEMIEALTIKGPEDDSIASWKIVKVEVQETDNMSAWVLAPKDILPPVLFWADGDGEMAWKDPDPLSPPTTQSGAWSQVMHHAWGNYGVRLNTNAEAIFGFGLYGDNLELTHTAHHPVIVTYALVGPPEPPPPPPPPPPISDYALVKRLEQAPHGFKDLRDEIEALPGTDMAALERNAKRDEDGNPLFHLTEYIIIHHDGNGSPHSVMDVARQAIAEGEPTIEYHLMIDSDAKLYFTARLVWKTNHVFGFNKESIGVCLLGDYSVGEPSDEQLEAMRFAIASLYEFFGQGWGEFRLVGLVPHRTMWNGAAWHTSCPGKVWPAILWSGPWPILDNEGG